ncbi:hypothetical protein DASC09_016240 [Saccharomycopsis crataegensis]|uniref:DASH complex subunit ASK1 n=1 Tax=Saccharomycopsis crataegensis TaxID=43959 RepID=A0AAV5QHT4_9ASCO|nr:hypothetical protein DASC09_016240 [Saccharomycopsis crataegensis]
MSKRKSIFDNLKRLSTVPDKKEASLDDDILQLESIDQEISKTLSLIHYNIDACNSIITNKFLPVLMNYHANSRDINNSTRFLKNLFENSLNVNIQVQKKYDENQNHNESATHDSKSGSTEISVSSSISNLKTLAQKVNVNDSESLLSETILSNDSSRIDIQKSMERFHKLNQNANKIIKPTSSIDQENFNDSYDDSNLQLTPTGKRELNSVFANRNRTNESSTADFIANNNSIIDQNTSTFTYEKQNNQKLKVLPELLPRKRPGDEATSPFKIQISPIKKRQRMPSSPTTPKRVVGARKSSAAIFEKLNIDDSPDDIPKTPELTYLKFSPLKMNNKSNASMNPVTKTVDKPHTSFASISATTLEIPQLPSSLNLDDTMGSSNYQTPQPPSFFDSSVEGIVLKSPPTSMKFALPKSKSLIVKSPVKALAKRYTKDYLDMELDDDESQELMSFELRNKHYEENDIDSTKESTKENTEDSIKEKHTKKKDDGTAEDKENGIVSGNNYEKSVELDDFQEPEE